MTWCPKQVALSLFPRLPLPFLFQESVQRGKDLGSSDRAPASGPQAPEPDCAFQDKAWGADKQARLNSVSSPVLRVIMTPCASRSALPCPALPGSPLPRGPARQGQMGVAATSWVGGEARILTPQGHRPLAG